MLIRVIYFYKEGFLMTSKEIIARLKSEGWIFKGQTGSYAKGENPVTKKS